MLLMWMLIEFVLFNNVQCMLQGNFKDFIQLVWAEHAILANVSLFFLCFYLFIVIYFGGAQFGFLFELQNNGVHRN